MRQLSDEQLAKAAEEFDAVKDRRFLPFDQLDEDEARAELDRRLLVTALGLPESLCEPNGPMNQAAQAFRRAAIRGGKQTRLVFTDNGEESVPR